MSMFTHPEGYLEARESHYQKFFGALEHPVMHSTDVRRVHVDIYQFAPTGARTYWTLITGGMSNLRQVEPGVGPKHMSTRAEIMTYSKEPQGWMFNVLKGLAEMPFDDDTCLHWWHTVPNGKPMTARQSLLTSYFFLPPYFEPQGFTDCQLDGDRVDFLWLIPITESEREYAIKQGARKLEQRFIEAELSPVIDESRMSIV
jgi:hypothetical protein